MGSDDLFDAISHPLRIEILKELSKRPRRFAEIKRELKIGSSGLLDFHLKKLDDLIMINLEAKCGEAFGLLDPPVLRNVLAWDAGNQDRKFNWAM